MPDRRTRVGSCCCECLRCQRPRARDPVSPRDQERRHALRLPLGRRAQACIARTGGAGMNAPSKAVPALSAVRSAETRVSEYAWETLSVDLNGYGCAVLEKLLS